MKKLLLLLILTLPFATFAQTHGDIVNITDPAKVEKWYDIGPMDKINIISKLGGEWLDTLEYRTRQNTWPDGLSTDDAFTLRFDMIRSYNATFLCTVDDGNKAIIEIKPMLNLFMPREMVKENRSFYMVVDISALKAVK